MSEEMKWQFELDEYIRQRETGQTKKQSMVERLKKLL